MSPLLTRPPHYLGTIIKYILANIGIYQLPPHDTSNSTYIVYFNNAANCKIYFL